MNTNIRPATRADLPAIVAMRQVLNDHELQGCPHASIVRMQLDQFTSVWGHTIDDPAYCWRIVEVDGEPAGYGMIYLQRPHIQPPIAYVQWAYLAAACRRLGLGEQLFDELCHWAQQQGAGRIELQFIDGNHIAENFWLKMGFQPYARRCVRYL